MVRPAKPDPSEIEADRAGWIGAHPAASLLEIEHAVDRQLRGLRAALIGEVAQAGGSDDPPPCPTCGTAMRRDGTRTVHQTTAHHGDVVLTGQTWRCPACGAVWDQTPVRGGGQLAERGGRRHHCA